jgi:hypothetical protein
MSGAKFIESLDWIYLLGISDFQLIGFAISGLLFLIYLFLRSATKWDSDGRYKSKKRHDQDRELHFFIEDSLTIRVFKDFVQLFIYASSAVFLLISIANPLPFIGKFLKVLHRLFHNLIT